MLQKWQKINMLLLGTGNIELSLLIFVKVGFSFDQVKCLSKPIPKIFVLSIMIYTIIIKYSFQQLFIPLLVSPIREGS